MSCPAFDSTRIPKRHVAGRIRFDGNFACARPVHLGNERWIVPRHKIEDGVFRGDEGAGEFRIGRMTDHHQ